jgi:polyhydroxyalkanoate synthesis repressor PhaR
MTKKQGAVRIIKKYPNRRLYDTQSSTYITLADVKQQVLSGAPFRVLDAKTDEDLTRSILLQIILEEEGSTGGGQPFFTEAMLTQFIRFYGHAMQGVMGTMLEKNMQAFTDMQQQFAEQSQQMMSTASPTGFSADAWQKLMAQNPLMSNMMSSYGEQSQDAVAKMQQQFKEQAEKMLGVFGKR